MADQFKLPSNITKADLLGKYRELLDAYRSKAREAEKREEERTDADKKADLVAFEMADGASAQAVVEGIGQLRVHVGTVLNDLTAQLTEHAEHLTSLKRAIELREARLEELSDLDVATDTLAKLTRLYDERKQGAEEEFSNRLAAMEAELVAKREALEQAITQTKASWEEEKARTEKEIADEKAAREKERKREEADFVYDRDRGRKLEEHDYLERKAAQERELEEKKKAAEDDLAIREARVAERETTVDQLQAQVDGFPKELDAEVKRARAEVTAQLKTEADHKLQAVELERQWEMRVADERVQHLKDTIASLEKQKDELQKDLAAAYKQLQTLADKSIQGASMSHAYESVHEIALEQARRDRKKKE